MPHKRKYYHLNSIRNFIIHFNEFGTELYKSKAAELLNEYLDFAIDKPSIDQNEAKAIFIHYIQPIGIIYSQRQKFINYTQPSTVIVFMIALFIIYFLLNFGYTVYLITFCLAVVIFIVNHLKYKKNEVFGYDF